MRYTDPSGHCGPLRTTLDGTVDALDIICQGAGGGSGITGEMIGKATAGATTITVGIGLETGVLEFPTVPLGVFSQDTTYPVGNICSEPRLLPGAPPVQLPSFFPGPILEMQWPTQVPGVSVERPEVLGDNVLLSSGVGRTGKQQRLRELADDPKIPSAIRGWIKQELNAIEQGKRKNIRVPPGYVLAHLRGFEAKEGYDYEYSDLQEIILHLLQHKHEGY